MTTTMKLIDLDDEDVPDDVDRPHEKNDAEQYRRGFILHSAKKREFLIYFREGPVCYDGHPDIGYCGSIRYARSSMKGKANRLALDHLEIWRVFAGRDPKTGEKL